jgi:hypothetical protein
MITENSEKARRDRIGRDCKRLMRESKKLIQRSRNLLKSGAANELSEVFGKPKTKSKAASASSRDKSRF